MKMARNLVVVSIIMLVFGMLIIAFADGCAVKKLQLSDTEQTNIDLRDEDANGRIYNFLLLGEDESKSLTDVLVIVSCDTKNKKMSILQIPRDTYAEYTSSSYRKINAARDVLGGGRELADFLTDTLGIFIDGYVSVNLDIIAEAVDILGGIEIDVPIDMFYRDPYQDLTINIKKGKQLINGEKAKQFVRYREGYIRGDLGRLDAQKLFVSAFLRRLSEKKDVLTLIQLVNKILPATESDISLKLCVDIIGKMGIPDMSDVKFMTLPGGDIRTSSGAWYYVMNRDEAFKIIKEYFNPELTEERFDPERKFTSSVRSGFNAIYDAQSGFETKIYSADELDDGIEIESKYD